MADLKDGSARRTDFARPKGPPWTFIALGACVLAVIGYGVWDNIHTRHQTEAVGDPDLARPTADECAIAEAVIGEAHASGRDAMLLAGVGGKRLRLRTYANSTAGFLDLTGEEADDAKTKADGDWRWCPGLGADERALGWALIGGDDDDVAEISLSRVAFDKAADHATAFESFTPPTTYGIGLHDKGAAARAKTLNWMVTLVRSGSGASWKVTDSRLLTSGAP